MDNKQEKVECVFAGPVFGGYWIPISEVEVIGYKTDPGRFGLERVSFLHEGKRWESAVVKKQLTCP
jgi:hypothetical protein